MIKKIPREVCALGGRSVPAEKRSFSVDRDLASRAGRIGGGNVPDNKRSFSTNRKLAEEAGRKGGKRSRRGKAVEDAKEHADAGDHGECDGQASQLSKRDA